MTTFIHMDKDGWAEVFNGTAKCDHYFLLSDTGEFSFSLCGRHFSDDLASIDSMSTRPHCLRCEKALLKLKS